jgi:response regulator RpfG family c-di-GMP phosphodiesterase
MASVLYFGKDDRVPKMLDQFFQDRLKESGESSSVTQIQEEQKFGEVLIGMFFDVIFVEQSVLPIQAGEWLKAVKKGKSQLKAPMILVGVEADPAKILRFIEAGWTDYIILPPDKPLLVEKVMLYATGKRSSEWRQVYSMTMSAPANLAKPAVVEELSEFDCKVRSTYPIAADEMMILYSTAFGPEGTAVGNVLGRCYQSEPHKTQEGFHQSSFYFVGITPDTSTNIRNTLRKQFVSGKSKG